MSDAPYSRSAEVYDLFYESMLDYPALALGAHGMIQAKRPGAKTLLEVACGTGLYLKEMSAWYVVTGLDISPEMLAVAAQRVPDVPLIEGDMADFDLGKKFDAVACVFSSIAYILTLERLQAALDCFARHLHDGGVLIVEPWISPDRWKPDFVNAEVAVDDSLAVARSTTSIVDGNRVTMRWAFAVTRPGGDAEAYVEEHPTALFTHEEYSEAFARAGFAVDYDPEGLLGRGRYIAVKKLLV